MADESHLKALERGVLAWNAWRDENPEIRIDLRRVKLSGSNLTNINLEKALLTQADLHNTILVGANLSEAELTGANLSDANLQSADLQHANCNGGLIGKQLFDLKVFGSILYRANLDEANLNYANLVYGDLREASLRMATITSGDLSHADLSKSKLGGANFAGANLTAANLINADLARVSFNGTNLEFASLNRASLREADLAGAYLGGTALGTIDLQTAKGLSSVIHNAPSAIGMDTIFRSQGTIPDDFLRGCGLSDWEIEAAKLYRVDLSNEDITDCVYRIHDLRAHQAIQISPLFISYSHNDGRFVDRLEQVLKSKGIRFWRDIHHATAGRLERQVEHAIRLYPTVLLVLSAASVDSDWVQHEVRMARKLEKETSRDVLCPVSLDDSWKKCRWPQRLLEQVMEFRILDFSTWENEASFQRMFGRLIEGLNLHYK